MSIVTRTQALKKLYKAVVGEDTTKNDPTKIISELADNWEGSGGGGSSDFSTAEVEFKNSSSDNITLNVAFIENNALQTKILLASTLYKTCNVVLYKGSYQIEIPFVVEDVSVDGSATVDDEEGIITITGDCTITIS